MKKNVSFISLVILSLLISISCGDSATYDHVFQQSSSPELPEGQTIQDVVNALNKERKNANGSFYVTSNSWAIKCNENYYWKTDQDPTWGAESTSSKGRSTIVLYWFNDAWVTEIDPDYEVTLNNHPYPGIPFIKNVFLVGCWPEENN